MSRLNPSLSYTKQIWRQCCCAIIVTSKKYGVISSHINGWWRKQIESWPSQVISLWRLGLATPFLPNVVRGHMERCFSVQSRRGCPIFVFNWLCCEDFYYWLLFHCTYPMKIFKHWRYKINMQTVIICSRILWGIVLLISHFPYILCAKQMASPPWPEFVFIRSSNRTET
jgi:hypothetical protein